MKKRFCRLSALLLILALILSACVQTPEKSEFDAGAYVSGLLDATYLGKFREDYLAMVGSTEYEAQVAYENGILREISHFYSIYAIETDSEELLEELKKLYKQIYACARLEVISAREQEDGSFLVEVQVEPIDIARSVYEELDEARKKFLERYPERTQNTMTTEEYRAFDAAWSQLILELYQSKIYWWMGYLPAQVVELRVEKDSQGYYGINAEDFAALDELVIDYSVPEELTPEESGTPEESPTLEESGTPEESPAPEESGAPQESIPPQESVDPNDRTPTPPTTATPAPPPTTSPSQAPDRETMHHVEIEVASYGTITLELDASAAPKTVENFLKLAQAGFYDGLTFHRIMSGFMIQGGDPEGTGYGGSDETVAGEFTSNGWDNPISHTRGVISMARSNDPDSASSQFFIVHQDSTFLDGSYAAFGRVTDGMEVVDAICADAVPTDDNGTIPAAEQPVITAVRVLD